MFNIKKNSFTFVYKNLIHNKVNINHILENAISGEPISAREGLYLYYNCKPSELFYAADQIRYSKIPDKKVSWQIDRNINYTNVCISGCLFCNFHCKKSQKELIREMNEEDYNIKIKELFEQGGDQLLLQGGLHPDYDISYYENLFKMLKSINPLLKLNALGPPEVAHIARLSNLSIKETLERLVSAGLDSLPGAGAEILDDSVRKQLSPAKPTSGQWIEVMKIAHQLGLGTTATMVYGHIESPEQRIGHLCTIRDIQNQKPENAPGFRAFIAWPMQVKGTRLEKLTQIVSPTMIENLKMVAMSRIILNNVNHIQASWLTTGIAAAQLALNCGADDMGSVMIEENVVSSAGANFRLNPTQMQQVIREAGFEPWLRNQDYTPRQLAD